MSKEYTYQHIRIPCTNCKSINAVYDSFHDETYCTECGTVLIDNTLPSITQEIEKTENRVKFIRSLWRKKRR